MNESIYAPPEADIAISEESDGSYYVVAPTKFLLLTILTANLYMLYWFYRQWKAVKLRDGTGIWPVLRAVFAVFFTHSLFADINETIRHRGIDHRWSAGLWATLFVLYIVMNVVKRVVSADPTAADAAWWLLTNFLPALLILPAQQAANAASKDPSGDENRKLTLSNWTWMLIGALMWLWTLLFFYVALFNPELANG